MEKSKIGSDNKNTYFAIQIRSNNLKYAFDDITEEIDTRMNLVLIGIKASVNII